MPKGVGSFFLLVAISGTCAFGCDSPPPDSRAAGSGGVTGVGGASTPGGTSTSLGASRTGGMANIGGSPVTGDTSTDQHAHQTTDAGANGPCVGQGTLADDLIPVHGTIRGPAVDGVLCDNGVGTSFGLAPPASLYEQVLQTTMDLIDPRTDDFLFSEPTNVVSAQLDGYVGASAAAVGTYTSSDACGWLKLELILPIPPNVACVKQLSPCDPGCEPSNGEMALCAPAHPRRFYEALPSIQCTLGESALGEWGLTLTSVSPSGQNNYLTHGRLTATLISETDPSDSVQLDLEF